MDYLKYLLLLFALASTRVCRAQTITDVVCQNKTAAVLSVVTLNCTVHFTGPTEPSVEIERYDGSTPSFSDSQQLSIGVGMVMIVRTIQSVQSADGGAYLCNATLGSELFTRRFELTVVDEFAFLITPTSLNISLGSTATLYCSVNQPISTLWYKNNDILVPSNRVAIGPASAVITEVDYSDIATYTCTAEFMAVIYRTSANLTIQTYKPLEDTGTYGFGLISTKDSEIVVCPVRGVPGPELIYWVTSNDTNVPTTEPESGPYVNENGELVLSKAIPEDSGLYTCIAEDPAGSRFSKEFNIEVVEKDPLIWTMWYLILVYAVVGMGLLILLALLIWFIVAMHDSCVVKLTKKVVVKERVRRPKQTRHKQSSEVSLDLPMYDPKKY